LRLNLLRERVSQLEAALESRVVIEQAKGILAARLDRPVEAAFELLRRAVRSHRVRLHELAAETVAGRAVPPKVACLL
jgi:AmiR/NasT family two-component response regulator